jgi:serine/threonine protein kinase
MSLQPGILLGAYRILGPLGAGGMGEVYRAIDTRLNRDVAIKVLPESFANDQDRLRRFEQEARATAALNHPNILTIYDIGTHEDSPESGTYEVYVQDVPGGGGTRQVSAGGGIGPHWRGDGKELFYHAPTAG